MAGLNTALGVGAVLGGLGLLWHFSRPAKERVGVGDTVVIGMVVTAPGDRGPQGGGGILPQSVETRMRVTSVTAENVTGNLIDLGNTLATVPRANVLRFA